jgi:hypothetical protein
MFGRRPAKPDPALLARVSDAAEVDLGTYPEDALAVVGAYPARHGLDHRPDGLSSFRRLDSQARKAAMQSALDRLIAEGTLDLPPGTSLEKAVAGGLDGKLAVSGPLAQLYDLACWIHRQGFQAGMIVNTWATDGLKGVQMPSGVAAPGLESCFGLPPSRGEDISVLLVERPDNQAGTRSYKLRTVRQEFTRMAGFLFAGVSSEGDVLGAIATMSFRFGQATLKVESEFMRKGRENEAIARITYEAQSRKRKKPAEPSFYTFTSSDLPEAMTQQFVSAAARTQ